MGEFWQAPRRVSSLHAEPCGSRHTWAEVWRLREIQRIALAYPDTSCDIPDRRRKSCLLPVLAGKPGEWCLEITHHTDTLTGHVPLQNVWCSQSGEQWSLESHAPQAFLHCVCSGRWVPMPWLNPWHWTEQPLLLLLVANTYCVSPTGPTGPQDGSCQSFLVWGLLWCASNGERRITWYIRSEESCNLVPGAMPCG